jgi:hypothetical protein
MPSMNFPLRYVGNVLEFSDKVKNCFPDDSK